jgi:amino acid transporter
MPKTAKAAGVAVAGPRPALSVFDAVMIICGIVIGGGIFAFAPLVASLTGSVGWMFGAWVLGAALSLVGALCYAELASAFPHAGGDYHFLTRAYGRDVSFFFAWARVTVTNTGSIAVHAFIFGEYATRILSLGPHSASLYALVLVVLLTALNVAGLRESSRAQNVVTLLLLAGMGLVIVSGFMAPAAAAPAPAPVSGMPDTLVLGQALIFVLFAYGGWNEAAYISAELRGGKRQIVRALVIAIAVITAIYLVFVYGLLSGLGFEALKASHAPGAEVAQRGFGAFGEKLIATVLCLTVLASSNATMIVGARSNYALARDWPIVGFMNRWDGGRDAPVPAIVVQGAITLALVAFAEFQHTGGVQTMVDFTAPVFWFFFMLTGIALFVLRARFPHVERPFPVPLYPVVPAVFVATCAYLFYSSVTYANSQQEVHVALYVMLAGAVAWAVARARGPARA